MPHATPFCRAVRRLVAAGCALAALLASAQTPPVADSIAFDVPAGEAKPRLRQFAAQAGREIVFATEAVNAVRTHAVKGHMTAQQALDLMLAETGLVAAADPKSGAIAVRKANGNGAEAKNAPRAVAQRSARPNASEPKEDKPLELPTFEVMSSKLLNMDLPRSRDDIQPYVVLDSKTVEQSGTTDLNEFLRARLTASATFSSAAQRGNVFGSISSVNLRGLGESQTLILVDGRRTAPSSTGFSPGQLDLNTIPLSAIERIEVLPATASAIYGGSATGGVINVVLKRNYAGGELKLTYENTFDTDTAVRRADFTAGFSLRGGQTNLMLSGSWSDRNMLFQQDRDLIRRGRAQLLATNPAALQPGTIPVLGATTNIRSTTGANLVLKSGTPLNASFTTAPVGYAGPASDGGAALVANAGRYNLGLSNSAASLRGNQAAILPHSRVAALSASLRHQFSPSLQAFAEVSASRNTGLRPDAPFTVFTVPATSPGNPFQQTIQVWAPTSRMNGRFVSSSAYARYAAGLIVKLPADWMMAADYTYSVTELDGDSSPGLAPAIITAINNGTLDLLRDLDAFPRDLSVYLTPYQVERTPPRSTAHNPALRFSGPLSLPVLSREAQLTLKLERVHNVFEPSSAISYSPTLIGGSSGTFSPRREQEIDSAYAELNVPVVSEDHALPWLRTAKLQASVRWDRYKTLAASNVSFSPPAAPGTPTRSRNRVEDLNPLLGLSLQPFKDLKVRTSYGTGFLPPEFNQLAPAPDFINDPTPFVDPRRGNTGPVAPYTTRNGGNPSLQPEHSRTLSAGLVLTPSLLRGLRVSLDYTVLEKDDEIATLLRQQILDNENLFPGRVTRSPNLPTDPAGWAGPVTGVDITLVNVTSARLQAYDLQADYVLPWKNHGEFSLFAAATWLLEFKRRVAPTVPEIDGAGVSVGIGSSLPLKFKANGGLTWTSGRWTLGWNGRYFDSYYVANPALATSAPIFLSQGNGGRVRSQHYHDVFGQYRFGGTMGGRNIRWLAGLELQIGVRNVFDKMPPYDFSNAFAYYSYLGDERGASYHVTVKRSF